MLTPEAAISAVEGAFGLALDGTLAPYPSYINRVYGLRTDDEQNLVAKFYRPGRWTEEALAEEHQFLRELAAADIPVVAPIADEEGETLAAISVESGDREESFFFALFPRRGGRNFDPETEDEWLRLGSVVGRIHAVGMSGRAPHRLVCRPDSLTAGFIKELLDAEIVHPEQTTEFKDITSAVLEMMAPAFRDLGMLRLHGDCHRGNILDRPGEGLLVIDFDDMMTGPAVQDLWLLLPGRANDSRRELGLLVEGYEQFVSFDRETLRLIEPLRFMRLIYFLAWRARQRDDHWFKRDFPEWGSKAFWIKELEDLREQALYVRDALES